MGYLFFETTEFLEEMIQGYYEFCKSFVSYDGEL